MQAHQMLWSGILHSFFVHRKLWLSYLGPSNNYTLGGLCWPFGQITRWQLPCGIFQIIVCFIYLNYRVLCEYNKIIKFVSINFFSHVLISYTNVSVPLLTTIRVSYNVKTISITSVADLISLVYKLYVTSRIMSYNRLAPLSFHSWSVVPLPDFSDSSF
jgi:uncharacterized membrane protein YesL